MIRLWMVMLLFWGLDIYTCHLFAHLFLCVGEQNTGGGGYCSVYCFPAQRRVHSCIPSCAFRSSNTVSLLSTSCASHPLNEAVISVNAPQIVLTHTRFILICAFTRSRDSYQSAMMRVFTYTFLIPSRLLKKHPWSFQHHPDDYCSNMRHTRSQTLICQQDDAALYVICVALILLGSDWAEVSPEQLTITPAPL